MRAYVANLARPPDPGRAAYVLYFLAALVLGTASVGELGRRVDARDARAIRETLAEGSSEDEFGDDFRMLTRPWRARVWTGLKIQHPVVNVVAVYSATVPRAARAWIVGFEVWAGPP